MIDIDLQRAKDGLEEFANENGKWQYWINAPKGEIWTFEEAWAYVFDDSRIGSALDAGEIRERYGANIHNYFRELSKVLKQVPPNLKPEDLIKLPVMQKVKSAAQKLLNSKMFGF